MFKINVTKYQPLIVDKTLVITGANERAIKYCLEFCVERVEPWKTDRVIQLTENNLSKQYIESLCRPEVIMVLPYGLHHFEEVHESIRDKCKGVIAPTESDYMGLITPKDVVVNCIPGTMGNLNMCVTQPAWDRKYEVGKCDNDSRLLENVC